MMHPDPITLSVINCHTCGRVSWPDDAVWLDPPLMLVSYRAGCQHTRDVTQVVDADQLTTDTTWCRATTLAGTRCRCRARAEWGGLCHVHARRTTGDGAR